MFKLKYYIVVYTVSILFNLFCIKPSKSLRKYERQDLLVLREEVREMFEHAYSSYLKYAYPYDELRPLTCDGVDTWGSYSLTLIDALDTLAVMGNFSEFQRVVEIVASNANFDANINVSVFETNIRIVGGLLSAHLLSQRAGVPLEPGWPCNGPLLRLAEDVAKRLLVAFDTLTGMPYGTINLRYGVPPGETPITCTAGVGTFILEFGTLSRLTGDPVYEEVALNAVNSLYERRSPIGLFGNHIDVMTGRWTAQDSGIGAGVDSYFEYLVKGSILLQRPELMAMFNHVRQPIDKYLKKNNWYVWASMHKGQVTLPVFQSLEAYWPGVLTLIGDIENALRTMHNYNSIWKQYGFMPEFYNIPQGEAGTNRESYPLRPELAESAMYLYRATGDPFMLDIGVNILRSIQHSAKTPCGYATIKDTRDHSQENRMESFFLAETTKYLYLLFDPENFIHNKGHQGHVHTLPSGRQCVLDAGGYIFNTEAHPIDPGALQCCIDGRSEETNVFSDIKTFLGESLTFKNTFENEKPEKVLSYPVLGEIATLSSELPSALKDLLEESNEKEKNPDAPEKTQDTLGEGKEKEPGECDNQDLSTDFSSGFDKESKKVTSEAEISKSDSKEALDILLEFISSQNKHSNSLEKKPQVVDENEENRKKNETKRISKEKEKNREGKLKFQGFDKKSQNEGVGDFQLSSGPISLPSGFQVDEDSVGTSTEGGKMVKEQGNLNSLPDFVQQLVSSSSLGMDNKESLDPQEILEKVRLKSKYYKTNKWHSQYQLLTCKAQPFSIRVTIAGEFLDNR